MYQRKRRRPVSDINVVPYIDVMLVLLIIFMVTAPLITAGVNVDLPKAEANPLAEDSKPPIVVSVTQDYEYFVTDGSKKDGPLNPSEIATIVAAFLQVEPDRPIMVEGDRKVDYDAVVSLMVLLQKQGVKSVGLMTDPVGEQ
ncbi:biopolymer transport protein [Catenovulum agarivorans DS-2]|uniref:Tol-Pal system protein TolR n=1 Tax=Catenovulum agarivorans DS-2 TaxID=1328313 RepID=W7QDQ2_9ALTE|nr:protein TolR [Catenovulum agarivorans]EWH11034.1 biopolymer transport protein [Catenovulum agarivorans DS-2]